MTSFLAVSLPPDSCSEKIGDLLSVPIGSGKVRLETDWKITGIVRKHPTGIRRQKTSQKRLGNGRKRRKPAGSDTEIAGTGRLSEVPATGLIDLGVLSWTILGSTNCKQGKVVSRLQCVKRTNEWNWQPMHLLREKWSNLLNGLTWATKATALRSINLVYLIIVLPLIGLNYPWEREWERLGYINTQTNSDSRAHYISPHRLESSINTTTNKTMKMHSGSTMIIVLVLVFADAWTHGHSLEDVQREAREIECPTNEDAIDVVESWLCNYTWMLR